VLRRVCFVDPHRRICLHIRLRYVGRNLCLDHRLGSGARICLRRGHGGFGLGGILRQLSPRPWYSHPSRIHRHVRPEICALPGPVDRCDDIARRRECGRARGSGGAFQPGCFFDHCCRNHCADYWDKGVSQPEYGHRDREGVYRTAVHCDRGCLSAQAPCPGVGKLASIHPI
jgi:hypothetical protein